MAWMLPDNGTTIAQRGSENGIIVRDEEHELGLARITLERDADNAPFAITCGIYGWMVHTRYFGAEAEAATHFERMKSGLASILKMLPCVDDPQVNEKSREVADAISSFVEQFP